MFADDDIVFIRRRHLTLRLTCEQHDLSNNMI